MLISFKTCVLNTTAFCILSIPMNAIYTSRKQLFACLRWIIRKCVRDDLLGDDIQKLFPIDLPLELQSTLLMLLQKYQSVWKEEASREQKTRISSQVKASAPLVTIPFPSSEIVSPMWPRPDDGARNFNRNGQGNQPLAAESTLPHLPSVSLHHDDDSDNLAILPHLKSMTWTMENRKSTPSKRVAAITLKLQDFSKNQSAEIEVKFQLSRDTVEAMIRSMTYIKDQLSNAGTVATGPLLKKQRQ